ncbi:nuclear GTPase SLIP-GC [Podospora conica]|nr:nuclear GTPase SLIP-GC [Schizothecium conicum]
MRAANPTAQGDTVDPELEELKFLQQLLASPSVEMLEKGVKTGIKALDEICGPYDAKEAPLLPESAEWLKSIDKLRRPSKTRTIIGVVGSTGAGKSSVISAVLDEERLLPTNCMRACTASVTEISYNDSADPTETYRAEIEFISAEDWKAELYHLRTDLLDGNGDVTRDCTNAETDAGIAYAKIKAVYPKKTKEMISRTTPDEFVDEPSVRKFLGSTKTLKATEAESLYTQLQTFVDSKEKNNEKTMEFWPLIKVVKIYVKAAALASGACIVDLPGTQDSNAARAAVAEAYMKTCTAIWVVAPINRAVDDKTAKNLLGESFRRQLKYDGTYTSVTFICSKTDDLSVTEAVESLGLRRQTAPLFHKTAQLEKQIGQLKTKVSGLLAQKESLEQNADDVDLDWEEWEGLATKLVKGKTVYAPTKKRKRKVKARPFKSRKGRKSEDSDDSDGSEASDKENSHPSSMVGRGQPLTSDEIDAELASLKSKSRALRRQIRGIAEDIETSRAAVEEAEKEKSDSFAVIKELCVKGRNEYSRAAIRKDFAMGIRELDQQDAEAQDPENFDPEVDQRDYDAIAADLPVYCVSSRAFQNLCGRLPLDKFDPSGFPTVKDTEVPALQDHACMLTEKARVASARKWLHEFAKLIYSMIIWSGNHATQATLTDSEKEKEEAKLQRYLRSVEKHIDDATNQLTSSMRRAIADCIYNSFDRLLPEARAVAPGICQSWGAPAKDGGMVWATYKATCKRHGIYSGASGARNMNQELFDPVSKNLAIGWDKAFQQRLPAVLDKFSQIIQEHLAHFHRVVTSSPGNRPGIRTLDAQLKTRQHGIQSYPAVVIKMLQELQKTANRSFSPEIQRGMIPGYEAASAETGTGSFMRMKQHMLGHVQGKCDDIFKGATDTVRAQLEEMQERVAAQVRAEMADLCATMRRDYVAVMLGRDADACSGLPRQERLLRAEVFSVVTRADGFFEGLFGREESEEEGDEAPMDYDAGGWPEDIFA